MKFFIRSKISTNLSKTREGFLVCRNVPITHLGPIEYSAGEHPFEDVEEDVTTQWDESIFSKEAMASFEGKPVVVLHPENDEDVLPENWKELAVGTMVNIRRGEGEESDHLICDLIIYDKEAIKLVESGKMREVSLGYVASWEYLGKGKAKRFKLRGNHCAIVENGRAGETCAIRDSKGDDMKKKVETKWDKIKKALVKTVDSEKEKELKSLKSKKSKDSIDDEIKKKEEELAALKAKKEEESSDEEEEKKKAEDEGEESEFSDRLSKIEQTLAKIVSAIEGSEEEEEDEEESLDEDEEEESFDEDEEDEEVQDEEEDEESSSKDSASIEILAPSKKFKGKDARLNALKEAYKSEDGKAAINEFTGGKAPSGSKEFIDAVFVGTVNMLKQKRSSDFSKTKRAKDSEKKASVFGTQKSPAELNAFYADHYKNQR